MASTSPLSSFTERQQPAQTGTPDDVLDLLRVPGGDLAGGRTEDALARLIGKGARSAAVTKVVSAAAALAARVLWAAVTLVVAARAGLAAVDLA